jgi:hypothetical protein
MTVPTPTQQRMTTMAEPVSTAATTAAAPVALTALSAAANASDLVQALDSYLGLVDPAEGCSLDVEGFVLRDPLPAEPKPEGAADKNRAQRPEGAPKSARVGAVEPTKSSSRYAHKYFATTPLVEVTRPISDWEKALGRKDPPVATLAMYAWRFVDSIAFVPFMMYLKGFDSKIGNQVKFKLRALMHADNVATVTTEVLYNPFGKESGYITVAHFFRLGGTKLDVRVSDFRWVPTSAVRCTELGSQVTITPR